MAKPIKRSEHIVKLSREHHFSLLFGWKIRTGLKKGVDLERIEAYIHYFWKEHQLPHFAQEDVLYEKVDDELVQRAFKEHREMEEIMAKIDETPEKEKPDLFQTIADKVTDHVRFEERILFPHLEEQIADSELAEIARKHHEMQPEPLEDNWGDEFWAREK